MAQPPETTLGGSMLPDNTGEKQAGRFAAGQSGNPAGKPKGARHKTTLAIQALLDGEGEALTRKAVELALAGDITALRLCLDRIAPARKDNPVTVELPPISTSEDAAKAMAAILGAVAEGSITPSEGGEMAKLVEVFIKTLESHEFEQRLKQLEERAGK
jgi:hypothetical protein